MSPNTAQEIFIGAHFVSVSVLDRRLISQTFLSPKRDHRGESERELVVLTQNLGLVPSTRMAPHSCL